MTIDRVAVLGAGSWGTAFAKVLADAGREVTLWARREEVSAAINDAHRNTAYQPGVILPANLRATSVAARAVEGADAVVLAVPCQSLRENLENWVDLLPTDVPVVSLAKGIELGSLRRMSQVIEQVAGVARERICVVSGPNLAAEIARGQPTATVIACVDHDRARQVQRASAGSYFRPYTHHDVLGCELAGACKNVIALACGVSAGLGFGANTAASLITRGLAEISRLGAALGAEPLTMSGLAGLGDLVATCSSPLSRNRSFGERLGKGEGLQQAQDAAHGQVAEGVKSCSSISALAARHGVEMPITQVVHGVCHDGADPSRMAAALLGREHKHEWT
ncbi:MAG: NAD(P)H-dependent glycerol-3-phosphate dehydrogenase [Sciscionella sp.]